MKKIFEKTKRLFNWIFTNRSEAVKRAQQIVKVARFISRHTKSKKDDLIVEKCDDLLKTLIHENLKNMDEPAAKALAGKISRARRGSLKNINVGLVSNAEGKKTLGFKINL